MTALEKTWHTEHFFCAQCGKQFGEEGFHEREGKPYCRDDYFDMFAPKCGGCCRAIMENYISALNNQWHPDCFVCRVRKLVYVTSQNKNKRLINHFILTSDIKPNQIWCRTYMPPPIPLLFTGTWLFMLFLFRTVKLRFKENHFMPWKENLFAQNALELMRTKKRTNECPLTPPKRNYMPPKKNLF